jgi:hypothetical protein
MMTRLGEPLTGWPVDLTRGVVQVLDTDGRPVGPVLWWVRGCWSPVLMCWTVTVGRMGSYCGVLIWVLRGPPGSIRGRGLILSQQEWERYVGAVTPYVRQCAKYSAGLALIPMRQPQSTPKPMTIRPCSPTQCDSGAAFQPGLVPISVPTGR